MALAPLAVAVVAVLCLSLMSIAAEPAPRIVLDPDTTKSGEKVTVHGFGFCGEGGCSVVRIVLEDDAVAEDVEIGPDGNFAVTIDALAPPGLHDVFAIQEIGTGGERTEAVAELTIGVGEQEPGGRRPIPR